MSILRCYICKEEFHDNDLAIPLNLEIPLPFGMFHLTIFTHYMCGLGYYIKDLANLDSLMEKDKMAIQEKLMEILNSMNKGATQ